MGWGENIVVYPLLRIITGESKCCKRRMVSRRARALILAEGPSGAKALVEEESLIAALKALRHPKGSSSASEFFGRRVLQQTVKPARGF